MMWWVRGGGEQEEEDEWFDDLFERGGRKPWRTGVWGDGGERSSTEGFHFVFFLLGKSVGALTSERMIFGPLD